MSLREIEFPPKDLPLREDVRLLGSLVGEVIREQGGDALFDCVESARTAAIRRREGGIGSPAELETALCGRDAERVGEIVRAFSAYFQVVNLAERVHRIRRGRDRLRDDPTPLNGSLADTVRRLAALGLDPDEIAERFAAVSVEPVFTAHPTEATRRAILHKQERIAAELIRRLDPSRTPHDERVALARIREHVAAAWQTEEHPDVRPTVADEREHVLYYVSGVLYQVLPALHERLDEALDSEPGRRVSGERPLIRFGSWVGGDMDGNPNVDGHTIRMTLERHREVALDAYLRELDDLSETLTQSASRVEWSEELAGLIERYTDSFPETARGIPSRHRSMGYRVALRLLRARVQATLRGERLGYGAPDELCSDLEILRSSLEAHRGMYAGAFGVARLLRRVRTFGFHLAALDVREDARELREAVAELVGDAGWPDRSAAERTERLRGWLGAAWSGGADGADGRLGAPGAVREPGERASRTLDVFRAIAEMRRTHGRNAIGSYIISMAQGVDDVLTVLWLARVAGSGSDGGVPLDVAPLFETVPDLEGAERVLDALFTDPIVRGHLERRGMRQMVMVGYSDSNKDGGIASARWSLHRALGNMARSAERHDVALTVFHGRGGTVSRGGGAVHRAVGAMPAAALDGRLRLTEQGEVIDAKYGLPQIALRNLERMLGAVALRAVEEGDRKEAPSIWADVAETVADSARRAYRELVYDDSRFVDYFRGATPIDIIERMAIGSRPPSRRSGAGVEDLRAIPWVFSWMQCRAMIPGWYGLGSGLEAARREHGEDALREVSSAWPFFDALLGDVEMVLAKADLGIAEAYAGLAPEAARPVFGRIRSEFERTTSSILSLRGHATLLEDDPTLRRSIRLRNPYVDPMNVLQVDLLRRWRGGDREDEALFEALLATVNGIARGMQNTG